VVEAGQLKLLFSHTAAGDKGITGSSDVTRWARLAGTKHFTHADQVPAVDPSSTPQHVCTFSDVSFCPGGIHYGRTP